MLDFREIELKDKNWIVPLLASSKYMGCEYSFSTLYMWRNIFHTKIAQVNNFLCCLSNHERIVYTYPVGLGDVKSVIDQLIYDSKERQTQFILRGITVKQKELLETLYPTTFYFKEERDQFDYIYSVEKLTKLAGKHFHGQRNHIARFKDNDNWNFEKITEHNIEECSKMSDEWCVKYSKLKEASLQLEACAVREAFRHFFELGMQGGLLRREGKVVAFTMGSPISEEVFDVNIEKAFGDIQGAYPMINQQFVTNCLQGYTYVNREEDLGEEGLRKAKLAYKPDILLEKYTATLLEEL
ncbi:MAG: DUF2156 domain-containing protein [Clostridiales bacterium]|nr:DUF2156 domain-containing protein [Clostridiales bacterium]